MRTRHHIYDDLIADHLEDHRQMVFLSGPRQVGKTTTGRRHADAYLNWDNVDDREIILAGPSALERHLRLDRLTEALPVLLLDELHKFPRWKSFLKGFYDSHGDRVKIIVTGSSRMEVYRRGGDSLMGRYFHYRMHPFSVAEIAHSGLPDPRRVVRPPRRIKAADYQALWTFGGYPEPFLKRDGRFARRWQALRTEQLVREDIRDLTQIQQIDQMESLVRILLDRSAQQLVYRNLAREVRISVDTARRWIGLLCDLHLGFLLRPWFKNLSRSLRKEPRWILRDWSAIDDPGQKAETFVGCQLLKAAQGWTDLGLGSFELGYLRDKEQREVDFLMVRDGRPWFLVEVKMREMSPSPALAYYQQRLGAPFAFQVTIDADHVDADCFARPGPPVVVPASTFLSQLL